MPVLADLHASDIDQLRPSTRAVPIVPSNARETPITNVTTIGPLQTLALTDASTATLVDGTDQVGNSSTLADTTGDTFTVTALSLEPRR